MCNYAPSRMSSLVSSLRSRLTSPRASKEARAEVKRDREKRVGTDPGPLVAINEGLAWLCRAQDRSASSDGGVARHYSLIDGWSVSYPETTGYIIPTLLSEADLRGDADLKDRARRMLDWLVGIQFPDGGFQGGVVGSTPCVPVTFNTGQILIGLASGTERLSEAYREPMRRAADWLAETQDADGCWRRFPTPFAADGEKVYETHVSWGLLEAARVDGSEKYASAAKRNIEWALSHQNANGWFAKCCLVDPAAPLTHTIGYVLRGVLEAADFFDDPNLIAAGRKTADSLLRVLASDGSLPGRLSADWKGTVDWACVTGVAQIAACWLILFEKTSDSRYREAAFRANRFVRSTLRLDASEDVRGGVKGSFPVDGDYGKYQYLNWACKFMIDANRMELISADRDLL